MNNARYTLIVDGGNERIYSSKAAAVRAGKREATQMFRVLRFSDVGGQTRMECVHAWDAPKTGVA